ncbi:MAG: hypothetical protein ACJ735_07830 [Actinomycetes bacterium]
MISAMRSFVRVAVASALAVLAASCVSTSSTVTLTTAQAAAIRSYAVGHFGDQVGVRPPRVGCAFHNFGGKRDGAAVTAYIVTMCSGEDSATDCSQPGSAGDFSIPTAVRLRGSQVIAWQQPGDGDEFGKGMSRLFPRALRHRMTETPPAVIDDLDRQVRTQLHCG